MSSSFFHFASYKYHFGSVTGDGLEGRETKPRKTSYKMIAVVQVKDYKSQNQLKIDMSNRVCEKEEYGINRNLVKDVDFCGKDDSLWDGFEFEGAVKHQSEGSWGVIVLEESQKSGLVNIDLLPETVLGSMESSSPSHE